MTLPESAAVAERRILRRTQDGTHYTAFISSLAEAIGCKSYFEIGVNRGKSITGIMCDSVGVDPRFIISENVVRRKPSLCLFQLTSDDFFKKKDLFSFFPSGFDLAFLDGMHQFEYLLRDFYNTERFAHPKSLILLHDCLPINAEMTEREHRRETRFDKKYFNAWTGDVWKLVPILRRFRPDLQVDCINCPPTGLVVVSKLDPTSTVLTDNYQAIVDEYMRVDLTDENFLDLHESAGTLDSAEYLASVREARALAH